jgi:hypothetical protein
VEVPGSYSADPDARDAERRAYWRDRYQKQLEMVASIERQIEVLDREIPGLWRDFYAWDDPMYRDGVIKPKLDEALGRRQRLEERLKEEQARVPIIIDGARRDGSTPGWFRGLGKPKPEEGSSKPDSVLPTEFDVDVVSADDT